MAAVALLLITGCANFNFRGARTAPAVDPQTAFEERLQAYVGRPVTAVVDDLGVPRKTMDLPDGGKALEYAEVERTVARSSGHASSWNNMAFSNGTETVTRLGCVYTFMVGKDSVVRKTLYEGTCY